MKDKDWDTLVEIKNELDANLMAYGTQTQEKFTELLVESLKGKGDRPLRTVSRTLRGGLPPCFLDEKTL
jgi:hypothetical protein